MNQSLLYELNRVMPEVRFTGLQASVCTIQARTNVVDPLGQVDLTDWVNVAGLVSIPCQLAVLSTFRPNIGASIRTQDAIEQLANRWLELDDYYPTILQQHSAVVDGVRYEIMAVEADSEKQVTRLSVRLWSL